MQVLFYRIFFVLLFLPSLVNADVFGGDTAFLSKMYLQNIEKIALLNDQLKKIKTSVQYLRDTVDTLDAVEKEYKFWTRFDIDNEVGEIRRKFLGGTLADEIILSNDSYARYELTKSMIRRRTRDPEDPLRDLFPPDDFKGPAGQYIENKARSSAYDDLSKDVLTNEELNIKDIARINASANTILAAEALEARARRIKEKIRRREMSNELLSHDKDFRKYLAGE